MAESNGEDRLFEIFDRLTNMPCESLSHAQRVFWLVWCLEADVNNGGFSQYFHNQADGPKAIAALEEIGALRCAAIVEAAVAAIGQPDLDWDDDHTRVRLMIDLDDARLEKLGDLDSEFYDYPDNLSDLLCRYAQAHAAEFFVN